MARVSFLTMMLLAAGAAAEAEESVVPPQQVVERLKREIGDKLLRLKPGQFVGPRLYVTTAPPGGPCSVRMPRADAGGGAAAGADGKMVLPVDPKAAKEQYRMPEARVPAPECPVQ